VSKAIEAITSVERRRRWMTRGRSGSFVSADRNLRGRAPHLGLRRQHRRLQFRHVTRVSLPCRCGILITAANRHRASIREKI